MRNVCRFVQGAALLAALSFAPSAPAGEPLSLAEAERRALAANPGLQAARLEAVAAGQRTAQAAGRRFGELDAVGTYNHFELDRIVVPMARELFADPALGMSQLPWDRDQLHYGLTWQLPLLAAGSLHEGARIARSSQSAAEHESLFTRDRLLYAVRAAYRNALILRHAGDAAEANRQTLARDEADAGLKVKIGAMPAVDAAKITYALRGAEAQVAELRALSATAQAGLAALLGEEPPGDGFTLDDLPGEPDDADPPGEDGIRTALAGRDDLLAARASTQVMEHRKRLALAAFSPQLVVQGTYLRHEAPSLHDPLYTREWAVMMKLPLFTGLGRIHAVREADANLRAARQRERAKELAVATEVADARGRLASARALFVAGRAQRELGREVARVEGVKLEQGTGRMEDYLAARSQEQAGETAYWRGLYAYQTAVDYLAFVTARGGNHE